MRAEQFEIVVKTGPGEYGWESVKIYMAPSFPAAKRRAKEERKRDPHAFVKVRPVHVPPPRATGA